MRKTPRPRASARSAGPGHNREAVDANERSENNFCSMTITQEVRDFAAKQNAEVGSFVAAEEAEAGMAELAERYREAGDLYVPRTN